MTEHFSLAELVASEYALRHDLDNTPDTEAMGNLETLAEGLERARKAIGDRPMIVTSGYRCPKVNSAIGGAKGSYHQKGLAADFHVPGMTPYEVCLILEDRKAYVGYDKIILEYPPNGWVHIQFPDGEAEPRGQEYTILSRAGGYQPGILEAT